MTSRRLAEELAFAESLPAGPLRQAWIGGVTVAGWAALSDAGRHVHDARQCIRGFRWAEAIDHYVAAGDAAAEARPVTALLDAESPAR